MIISITYSIQSINHFIQIAFDFGKTILACTPSYALILAKAIDESGIKRVIDNMKYRSNI